MATSRGDVGRDEVIALMNRLLQSNPNTLCYLKWTCPGCGERAMVETPNVFYEQLLHEECGTLYRGEGGYGLSVEFRLDAAEGEAGEEPQEGAEDESVG